MAAWGPNPACRALGPAPFVATSQRRPDYYPTAVVEGAPGLGKIRVSSLRVRKSAARSGPLA